MARVLVTGATGFVGSHLAAALVAQGHELVCLVRPTSDRRWLATQPVACVVGSLTDAEALGPLVQAAEYVYHLAGATRAVRPEDFIRTNAVATAALARVCAERGARLRRLLVVSSQSAAGPGTLARPRTEDDPPEPVSAYGRSKLAGERAALASGAPVTVVRPAFVYGPRDREGLAIYRLLRLGLNARIGRIEALNLVHVRDLVDGLVRAAEAERSLGQTYFLAHPTPVTQEELGATIARALGARCLTLRVPDPLLQAAGWAAELAARLANRPALFNRSKVAELLAPGWVCSPRRAQEELGFSPRVALAEGVAETVAWYRQAGWL